MSIAHRLFLSVLLAMLAIMLASGLVLRQRVLSSFGDYAVAIELDRLDELATSISEQYRTSAGWKFLPDQDARRSWISAELVRLQGRNQAAPLSAPVSVPSAPQPLVATDTPVAAPAPPAPPAIPLPPLPPPPVPASAGPLDDVEQLHARITLLDSQGRYLAGRALGAVPLTTRPISVNGRVVGELGVVRGQRPSDALSYAFIVELGSSLWLLGALAVLLSALAAWLLARHFRRPIAQLAATTASLAAGDYHQRSPATRSDELGMLARDINQLAERLDQAEQARRQWVADTSHELRTPLAVLRAQIEALQDGVRQATPETLSAMHSQALDLNHLVDDLNTLARTDAGQLDCILAPVDLTPLVRASAQAFEQRFQHAQLSLELMLDPGPCMVQADPERLRQVLSNLLENSLRYTQAGGVVRLTLHAHAGQVLLQLDDSAPGVPDAALPRLAERFYRVDRSRSRAHGGAGLGLALCARLLEAQQARLAFAHSPLGGLRVTLTFIQLHPVSP